ncbi:exodeoxyribonuclease V subunit alpha [Candidatus Erwinia haradaeae]|uniref:RecBCD enzyme subunit RecD n=1 Tax=Candidatus Erwinia haradaeae TaxID=1922217 RepID=A0A451DAM7_9GAMM|nr:exodeoxyribonuclease V subunit alpha [Candidatus Erwinia haradaeae]VFP83382.1 RecBCD enzyme subunit RecD [Candidatus Erwinia haradaeae]
MRLEEALTLAKDHGLIHSLDIQFSRMIAERDSQPVLILASVFLSRDVRAGHVCLPLINMCPKGLFSGLHRDLAQIIWDAAGMPEDIESMLLACVAVSDGQIVTPLVLENNCLYLYRMWHSEVIVTNFIQSRNLFLEVEDKRTCKILDYYFDKSNIIDWQKIAVAIAITSQLTIISGGPGTGKTTIIAKLLCVLIELLPVCPRIKVVALTGKAAARLTESLHITLQSIDKTCLLLRGFPSVAITLHRLLGVMPGSQKVRFHADNHLPLDILVIDEASMIDLSMMAHLVSALSSHTRVILIGDQNQLCSVEAGSVFGDLCYRLDNHYSLRRAEQLSNLTGYKIIGKERCVCHSISDVRCVLPISYRFKNSSGIGQLALAVNSGKIKLSTRILNGNFSDVSYRCLQSAQDYNELIDHCVKGYHIYLNLLKIGEQYEKIIMAFRDFRVLCTIGNGLFGTSGLNENIEKQLYKMGLIYEHSALQYPWYIGRPIIIMRNNPYLQLYNGDIGIALLDDARHIKVWFLRPNGDIKGFNPFFLPLHSTAFAMTVHKAQGSEFDRVVLILPNQEASIITRQLIYTAITRAKKNITIYANEGIFQKAVRLDVLRRSGLLDKLYKG